jgi:hypothetical protein
MPRIRSQWFVVLVVVALAALLTAAPAQTAQAQEATVVPAGSDYNPSDGRMILMFGFAVGDYVLQQSGDIFSSSFDVEESIWDWSMHLTVTKGGHTGFAVDFYGDLLVSLGEYDIGWMSIYPLGVKLEMGFGEGGGNNFSAYIALCGGADVVDPDVESTDAKNDANLYLGGRLFIGVAMHFGQFRIDLSAFGGRAHVVADNADDVDNYDSVLQYGGARLALGILFR